MVERVRRSSTRPPLSRDLLVEAVLLTSADHGSLRKARPRVASVSTSFRVGNRRTRWKNGASRQDGGLDRKERSNTRCSPRRCFGLSDSRSFRFFRRLTIAWRTTSSVVASPRYVGLQNFVNVLSDGGFWYSLLITLIYVVVSVPIEVAVGFLLAWIITVGLPARGIFRAIFTAPLFTMEVAIGYLGVTMFTSQGGMVSTLLSWIGLEIPWMATAKGGWPRRFCWISGNGRRLSS